MKWAGLPVLVYTALLVYYSLISPLILATQPGGPLLLATFSFHQGFYIHVAAYLILAVLWRLSGLRGLGCFLTSSATGALLEMVQPLFHRYASLVDMAANTSGALIGFGIATVMFDRCFARWSGLRLRSPSLGRSDTPSQWH